MTAPDWTVRAPRSLTDLACPQGHFITQTQDRRWLHRLAMALDHHDQRQLRLDLARYLADTCAHHWHDITDSPPVLPLWQCLWCCRVEGPENPQAVTG
jgi:hypothetical protein